MGAEGAEGAVGAEGSLEVLAAWYGDGDNVWEGSGVDVTREVRRLVQRDELHLNAGKTSGWYNARFTDSAPGTWKVMAVRYRYGEGESREVISPKKAEERAALIITPTRCSPRPSPPSTAPYKPKASPLRDEPPSTRA